MRQHRLPAPLGTLFAAWVLTPTPIVCRYRAAEAAAKAQRLRVWKNFVPNAASSIPDAERSYTAVVEEVVNAEVLIVRVGNELRRINLSSVRQPRKAKDAAPAPATEGEEAEAPKRRGGGNRMWDTPNGERMMGWLRQ